MQRLFRWSALGAFLFVAGCFETVGPTADAETFCTDEGFWSCRREQVAGRITDAEFDACIAPIETRCEDFVWPTGCSPSEADADRCIELLRHADYLTIPTDELIMERDECRLCE